MPSEGAASARSSEEAERLATLQSMGILDSPVDEELQRITRLAARLFHVPIAAISFIDEGREWFKSRIGLEQTEIPIGDSFCIHSMESGGIMEVEDATADPRFRENPLVLGAPGIRFYAGCPISGPNGTRVGTICVIDRKPRHLEPDDRESLEDLAAMVEREFEALELATTDELTGLCNRRGFFNLGRLLLDLTIRNGEALSVLSIDLDNMKEINDSHGHSAGDAALSEISRLFTSTLRRSDVIGRLGGDEFAVVLAGTDAGQADVAVARIRLAVHYANAEEARPYQLALSVGAATLEPGAEVSLEQLVEASDARMYSAKRSAR